MSRVDKQPQFKTMPAFEAVRPIGNVEAFQLEKLADFVTGFDPDIHSRPVFLFPVLKLYEVRKAFGRVAHLLDEEEAASLAHQVDQAVPQHFRGFQRASFLSVQEARNPKNRLASGFTFHYHYPAYLDEQRIVHQAVDIHLRKYPGARSGLYKWRERNEATFTFKVVDSGQLAVDGLQVAMLEGRGPLPLEIDLDGLTVTPAPRPEDRLA